MAERSVVAFAGPWDRVTRGVTLAAAALIVGATAFMGVKGALLVRASMAGGAALLAGAALLPLILIIPAALAPRAYAIRPDALVILRRAADIVVPLTSVRGIEMDEAGEVLRRAYRLNGSGGGFGVFGYFDKPGFGYYRAYCTRTTGLVILRLTGREPLVISPDRPEQFVQALEAARAAAGPAAETP